MPGHSPPAEPSTRRPGAPPSVDEVLELVRTLLIEIIGPEYALDLAIELDTALDEDLELESMEFVALNERLLGHYGDRVDFIRWLADKELDEIIGLTVGDLVSFVAASLETPAS